MKALVVHGANDLRFDDLPAQAPEPGQVLVRNTHGGICGSDLHYYKHGAVGAFTLREPLVLGHEVADRDCLRPSAAVGFQVQESTAEVQGSESKLDRSCLGIDLRLSFFPCRATGVVCGRMKSSITMRVRRIDEEARRPMTRAAQPVITLVETARQP